VGIQVTRDGAGRVRQVVYTPDSPAAAPSPDRPQACTDCGRAAADPGRDLRWFPFATYACPDCAAKRDARAEAERRAGQVCRLCRRPWSLCTC
jgi:hypothetical protein